MSLVKHQRIPRRLSLFSLYVMLEGAARSANHCSVIKRSRGLTFGVFCLCLEHWPVSTGYYRTAESCLFFAFREKSGLCSLGGIMLRWGEEREGGGVSEIEREIEQEQIRIPAANFDPRRKYQDISLKWQEVGTSGFREQEQLATLQIEPDPHQTNMGEILVLYFCLVSVKKSQMCPMWC